MPRRGKLARVDVIGDHGAADRGLDHRPTDHIAHLLYLHVDGRPLSRELPPAAREGRAGRLELSLQLGNAGIEVVELLLRRYIGIEEPLDPISLRAQVTQLRLQWGGLCLDIG